jgi:hypothetical protein
MVKTAWLEYYEPAERPARCSQILQSWGRQVADALQPRGAGRSESIPEREPDESTRCEGGAVVARVCNRIMMALVDQQPGRHEAEPVRSHHFHQELDLSSCSDEQQDADLG